MDRILLHLKFEGELFIWALKNRAKLLQKKWGSKPMSLVFQNSGCVGVENIPMLVNLIWDV
jgi:hypothetical protein